jgi:hypothetical protein
VVEGQESGVQVTVSHTTPIELEDGRIIKVADVKDDIMLFEDETAGRYWKEMARARRVGRKNVCKIYAGQRCYSAATLQVSASSRTIRSHRRPAVAKGYIKLPKNRFKMRAPEALERPNPDNNNIIDPYDMVLPGLYPDEDVLKLSTGETIAVSVEPKWRENRLVLKCFARWLEKDGSTRISPDGQPLEVETSHTFDDAWLEAHSESELATEIIRLMIGEEPAMVKVDSRPKLPPPDEGYPDGTIVDPHATEVPLLPVHPEGIRARQHRDGHPARRRMEKLQLAL